MRNLFIFGAGLLAAWFGGESRASWLYGKIGGDWEIALWGARFLAFLGGSLAAQILLDLRRKSGGGVSAGGMTMMLRPVTGWLIGLTVQAAVLFGFLFILVALINAFLPIPNDEVREQAVAASFLMTGLVYWLFFGWNGERNWVYTLVGKLTSPLRRLLRVIGFGKGALLPLRGCSRNGIIFGGPVRSCSDGQPMARNGLSG